MTSRVHGVIDYLTGVLLIIAPILLGFANGGPEQIVPQALGGLIIVVSLITAYEISVAKIIPYRLHLLIDVVQAVVLLGSPFVLGYATRIWWPHVLVGVVEIVVVIFSLREAGDKPVR